MHVPMSAIMQAFSQSLLTEVDTFEMALKTVVLLMFA